MKGIPTAKWPPRGVFLRLTSKANRGHSSCGPRKVQGTSQTGSNAEHLPSGNSFASLKDAQRKGYSFQK